MRSCKATYKKRAGVLRIFMGERLLPIAHGSGDGWSILYREDCTVAAELLDGWRKDSIPFSPRRTTGRMGTLGRCIHTAGHFCAGCHTKERSSSHAAGWRRDGPDALL